MTNHGDRAANRFSQRLRRWFYAAVRFISRHRVWFSGLSLLLVSITALGFKPWAKLLFIITGVGIQIVTLLVEGEVERSRRDELEQTIVFNNTFATCIRDITLALEDVKQANYVEAKRKLEDVQEDLLQLIADACIYVTGGTRETISSNLMLPKWKNATRLDNILSLVKFSHRHMGREFIDLPLNTEAPGVGAAAAFVTCGVQYIPDTTKHEVFDQSKPYRSIVSYPLLSDGISKSVGVVNIDSTEIYAFGKNQESDTQSAIHKLVTPWLQSLAETTVLFGYIVKLESRR